MQVLPQSSVVLSRFFSLDNAVTYLMWCLSACRESRRKLQELLRDWSLWQGYHSRRSSSEVLNSLIMSFPSAQSAVWSIHMGKKLWDWNNLSLLVWEGAQNSADLSSLGHYIWKLVISRSIDNAKLNIVATQLCWKLTWLTKGSLSTFLRFKRENLNDINAVEHDGGYVRVEE